MATLSISSEFGRSFSISQAFFHVIGLFPFPEVSLKWRLLTDFWFWISYINLVLCAVVEFVTILIGFVTKPSHFVANIALVPLVSYTVIGLEQILNVYRRRDRIIALVVALRESFLQHSPEDLERYNFSKFQQRNRKLQVSYSVSYITLIMTFNFISIWRSIYNYLSSGRWYLELPYAVWYPFNVRDDRFFMLVYMQQLWWGFTCIVGVLAINLLLSTISDHICFQFHAVETDLRALKLQRETPRENREKIQALVEKHNRVIGQAEEFGSIISFTLLMNFLLISVVMCTVGFQVIATESRSESLKFLLFLMVCLLQTVSLSYFGNCIIDASLGVGDGVYGCDWLEGDLTSKKFILFIILRSQRPVCLRAETFSIVSLKNFSSILSTSYSYFTILRQMYYGNPSKATLVL